MYNDAGGVVEPAWKAIAAKARLPPQWLIKKLVKRNHLLKLKEADDLNAAKDEDQRIPPVMTPVQRRQLTAINMELKSLHAAYGVKGTSKHPDCIYAVPNLYPPKKPVRGAGQAQGELHKKFVDTDADNSDLYFMAQDGESKSADGKPKPALQVAAMYDDLSTSRHIKTAAATWPIEMTDEKGLFNEKWKGDKPEDFARLTYPYELHHSKKTLVPAAASSSKDDKGKENYTSVIEEWVGPAGVSAITVPKAPPAKGAAPPKAGSEHAWMSLESTVSAKCLRDLEENNWDRVECEKELAYTRHSSFNAGSRLRKNIKHNDEYEVAAKDWEIELNICTDPKMSVRPTKLVFQRKRKEYRDLKPMYDQEKYDGSELLTWGQWTRKEAKHAPIDGYLLNGWAEGKVSGNRKLDGLAQKVAQKRSENNVLKYRNELLMQMLTCAQMDLEKYDQQLEYQTDYAVDAYSGGGGGMSAGPMV